MSDFWVVLGRCCSDGEFLNEIEGHVVASATNMDLLENLYNFLWNIVGPAQPIPPDESAVGLAPYRLGRTDLMEVNRVISELKSSTKKPHRKIQEAVEPTGKLRTRKLRVVFGLACIDKLVRGDLKEPNTRELLFRYPPRIELTHAEVAELQSVLGLDAGGKTVEERMAEVQDIGWVVGCGVGTRRRHFPYANPATVHRILEDVDGLADILQQEREPQEIVDLINARANGNGIRLKQPPRP